jgi:multidrug resistance efflux pump
MAKAHSDESATVTTAEAADLLSVDPRRVRELFETGVITGRKLNARMTILDRESVEAYRAARAARRRAREKKWAEKDGRK